jgi:RHS repeat-associated protein
MVDSNQGKTSFEYDAAGRLVRELGGSTGEREFRYDPAGNLLAQPGLSGVQISEGNLLSSANGDRFSYNDRNHIVRRSGPSCEQSYEYDALDRLVRCTNGSVAWMASYDPLGRRISKEWGEGRIEYFWDDFRLAAEWSDDCLRIYVYADRVALVPFMFVEYENHSADPESGKRYFVFTNQIGTPVRIEDDRGEVVWSAKIDPYGRVTVDPASTIKMPLRFPGHYHDEETGLHYNRFRYYSPELGRYLQSDPLGIAGGLNLYAYSATPLNMVDLDGLACPGQKAANNTKSGKSKSGPDAESTKKTTGFSEDLPSFKGKTPGEVRTILRKKGFVRAKREKLLNEDGIAKTDNRGGSEIWVKKRPDGDYDAVRIDQHGHHTPGWAKPSQEHPEGKQFAGGPPHVHKEVVPEDKIQNYVKDFEPSARKMDDANQPIPDGLTQDQAAEKAHVPLGPWSPSAP